MKLRNILYFGLMLGLAWGCEEPIDLQVEAGESQLTVDAWVTDQLDTQRVRLTLSQPYLGQSFNPPALGATVEVADDRGQVYAFTDADNDGTYIWVPDGEPIGRIGGQYGLRVSYNGQTYVAASAIFPVPPIDSLVYRYEEEALGQPEGYYAEFYATDLPGPGNCYWIKTYKNGRYLGQPFELNVAYDASFSPGASTDGIPFISPIRTAVNPVSDPDVTEPPYAVGDSIYVELHSIAPDAFFYLLAVAEQLQNGGLFAVPTSNVPTNLVNADPNSTQRALGFFGASAVNSVGVRIEE